MELNGLLMPHKTDLVQTERQVHFLVLIDAFFICHWVFLQDEHRINNPLLQRAFQVKLRKHS